MSHLLVTNDFPPKAGGIQSYLYELWRRLPPDELTVLTSPHDGAAEFDRKQSFKVVRSQLPLWLPTQDLATRIGELAAAAGAGFVVLDPALPLGLVGRSLRLPYAVVLHGAEVTVPGRLPISRKVLRGVLEGAALVIAAGEYPASEGTRALPASSGRTVVIPPGVDISRFQPLTEEARAAARRHLGLPVNSRIVVGVSRLVPRKGMDVLIEAVALLARQRADLKLVIGGQGRDRVRLEVVARLHRAPVIFAGYVADSDLPLLNGTADVAAMLCRDRWLGLEQEGFGIVFLEAGASGTAVVAGRSGGAAEAVVNGETGVVVDDPADARAVAAAMAPLLDDPGLRRRFGAAARRRIEQHFDYDVLASRLHAALLSVGA